MMPVNPRASISRNGSCSLLSKATAIARQPATAALTLAEWLRRFCRLFDCGRCYCDGREIPCRVLAARPQRCHEAEHGALLGAPETVLAQYRRVLFLTRTKASDQSPDVTTDVPEPAPLGRQCRCGAPMPPRRKLCDRCRAEARRRTKRESQGALAE
jgi:hypothetical protein